MNAIHGSAFGARPTRNFQTSRLQAKYQSEETQSEKSNDFVTFNVSGQIFQISK